LLSPCGERAEQRAKADQGRRKPNSKANHQYEINKWSPHG
jgi:hypothetical protein